MKAKKQNNNNIFILTINCGSSSVKYKLFSFPDRKVLTSGLIEQIGEPSSTVRDHHQAIEILAEKILSLGISVEDVKGVGHRVVHGGERFIEPTVISEEVVEEIRALSDLAPLHNPANLEGIIASSKILPSAVQVAVFDTAFHSSLPDYAYIYALPYEYYEKYGIRRYGFHGTSHQYVAIVASKRLKKPLTRLNLITCHLGNGCSVTAVKKGKSVDTSMGMTPLEGLVMGTRSGDIDPALILFLQEKENLSPKEMDKILNKESGLKGISGVSNDFRILIAEREKGNERAKLAIEVFKYRLLKYVGAYAMILGRVDAIVFTGGIGEHVKEIRDYVGRAVVRVLKQKPKILVIPTDEELMIAEQTYRFVG